MYYTRIPVPKEMGFDLMYESQSKKFFPLIGIIVGFVIGVTFLACLYLKLSISIAVIFSMIVSVFLTGALHEDGLADVCDGFGGGYTKDRILEIMKDSRVGVYGVIALIFSLLLKYQLIYELMVFEQYPEGMIFEETFLSVFYLPVFLFIAAHSMSRFATITFVNTHEYARRDETSKASGVTNTVMSIKDLFIAGIFGLVPMFLLNSWWLFIVIIPVFFTKYLLGTFYKKQIGGYTGDCLGASQQVLEIVFYLSVLILWNFI